jgi:hypothetical protein
VTVLEKPPTRSSEQNRLLHSALRDIAEQVEWKGQRFTLEIWKRLCMASWLREQGDAPLLIPALDGNGVDIVYEKTSRLSVAACSDFLTWCYSFGAQNGVKWKY